MHGGFIGGFPPPHLDNNDSWKTNKIKMLGSIGPVHLRTRYVKEWQKLITSLLFRMLQGIVRVIMVTSLSLVQVCSRT